MEKVMEQNNYSEQENELKDIYGYLEEIRSHCYIAYCALTSDAEEPEKEDLINTFYSLAVDINKVKIRVYKYTNKYMPNK